MTQRTTRAERMAQPRAAEAIRMLAEASGGCIRPVQLRRANLDTGQTEQVIVPCGSPLESAAGISRTNPPPRPLRLMSGRPGCWSSAPSSSASVTRPPGPGRMSPGWTSC